MKFSLVTSVLFFFLFSSSIGRVVSGGDQYASFGTIALPPTATGPTATGPTAIAFDLFGGGPYVGVADGRILKWLGPDDGFVDFAYTSPNRTKELCDGTTDPNMGPICGKPLSLSFNYRTGQLYIADSYLGLRVVGPCGGLATLLASSAENVAFQFLSCVDVDQLAGTVYFTDVSQFYDLSNHTEPGFFNDSSGRLLSYDPETRRASVLMKGIRAATGVAISANGNFLLVSEFLTKRIHRFWLRGSRASTSEIFSNLTRNPLKIRRTPFGDFWVAMASSNPEATPIEVFPLAQKFNSNGGVVAELDLDEQYHNKVITGVVEHRGALYPTSAYVSSIGVYKCWETSAPAL